MCKTFVYTFSLRCMIDEESEIEKEEEEKKEEKKKH